MIAAIGLVLGIVAGLFLEPTVPTWLQPYLPIAVVAALDAVFGGLRALLDGIFDDRVFVVSFVANVLVAALIVFLGDQLGVGAQLSTGVVVVLGHPHLLQRRRHPPAPVPGMSDDTARAGRARPARAAQRASWQQLRSALRPGASQGTCCRPCCCALLGFAAGRAGALDPGRRPGRACGRTTWCGSSTTSPSGRTGCAPRSRDLEDTRDRVTGGTDGTRAALEEARERARGARHPGRHAARGRARASS